MIKHMRFDFDFEQCAENHSSFILLLINKLELNEVTGSIAESIARINNNISIHMACCPAINKNQPYCTKNGLAYARRPAKIVCYVSI